MRKLLLAMSALAAFAAVDVASAADMELKAPPPPPVDVWGGWYAGLNVGGSFGRVRTRRMPAFRYCFLRRRPSSTA